MAVKIRLMRIGTTGHPFYRVVAVDERKKRTGEYIELLGTYNPLTEPKEIILKQDRIDEWIKKGAQPSTGYLRIIGKAPKRAPRKPKKAPAEESAVPAPVVAKEEEAPAPESTVTETPVQETETQPAEEVVAAPSTPEETAAPVANEGEEAISEGEAQEQPAETPAESAAE